MICSEILTKNPEPLSKLNASVPSGLEVIIRRALEKDRELRYQHAADMRADLQRLKRDSISSAFGAMPRRATKPKRRLWFSTALVIVLVLGGAAYLLRHRPARLSDRDTIVLADFDNKTGDPVFDDALKQGLAIQLEQSPFLDLVSDNKVNQILKLMGRSSGDALTAETTREVCQRGGSKAMLTGSIAPLGSQYVIGLKAVNCYTGDVLAEAQAQARDKETVLKALDAAAVSLRGRLGESLGSVQRYATPLEEATTPSLDALRAYSLGIRMRSARGDTASLPFLNQAVQIDGNFARAYAVLSMSYSTLNELGPAAANARKAYDLRDKVSERERLYIDSNYYQTATGDLEKAAQVYELWQQIYPRDFIPWAGLGFVRSMLGAHEKAMQQDREALRLNPDDWLSYATLGDDYKNLNLLDEAETIYKKAEERHLEDEFLVLNRYELAFLKGNQEHMARLSASAAGKPGTEDVLLASQADTKAWYGRFEDARELTRRAIESAQQNGTNETAASYQAAAAWREAEAGNFPQAKADADAAVKLGPNRLVQAIAVLALARAGEAKRAERLAAQLDQDFPEDTLMQRYWLPTIRAAVALQRRDPHRAVEELTMADSVELGAPTLVTVALCPAYLRGQAYLMMHDGKAAATEFQKFLTYYGLVANFPLGAMARLGLARAYASDAASNPESRKRAGVAYRDFLNLWKDADPDLPLLREAKAEAVRLQ
ncbi:MAG: hypothetical protein WA655_17590 [Candidatus Korobacteraceae bacterium]